LQAAEIWNRSSVNIVYSCLFIIFVSVFYIANPYKNPMMKKVFSLLVVLLGVPMLWALPARSSEAVPAEEDSIATDSIRGRCGTVVLEGCRARVDVPEGYVYLDKEQSSHLLCDYWNNPADDEVLGLLVADDAAVYDEVTTAFVLYYVGDGYVSDEDADAIDYAELLKELQASTSEQSAARVEEGYDSMELIGWAAEPRYDKQRKVLRWAKHLRFADRWDTLNYDIRILGKEGFLIVQAVADLTDYEAIVADEQAVIDAFRFDEGYTYADFDPARDRIAEWTIGSLIAGKVLLKAGVLAKLGIFFAKFWKVLLLAFVAVGAFFKRRRSGRVSESDASEGPADGSQA